MKLSDIKKGYADMNGGVWVGNIPLPLFDGIRLKTRRLWNPDYIALHDKLTEAGELDQQSILDECLLAACLLGWEGVDDAYAPEAARALLGDPEAGPVFRSAILYAAQHVADQVKAQIEADAKNSPTP